MNEKKKLLSISATAETLSLSKTTVRTLIRLGVFTPNRVTRRVLIPTDQVEDFAAGNRAFARLVELERARTP